MDMKFLRPYTNEDLPLLEKYSSYIDTLSYFYKPSFIHLWKEYNDTYIYEGMYGLYIYIKANNYFLMPWTKDMQEALKELKEIAKIEELPLVIKSIPDEFLQYFDDTEFELRRDRNLDEYIYLQEKLIGLSGRHLQSKRNHISQFVKNYPLYSIEELKKENEEEVLAMTKEWLTAMDEEHQKMLKAEYLTIENAFSSWDVFDFSGAILRIEGKIVAYTLAEKQNNCVVVHYEKANTNYHGTYTMINREYELNYAPKVLFVNRMEDAGVEGLRKAKESYKPIRMVQKWRAIAK